MPSNLPSFILASLFACSGGQEQTKVRPQNLDLPEPPQTTIVEGKAYEFPLPEGFDQEKFNGARDEIRKKITVSLDEQMQSFGEDQEQNVAATALFLQRCAETLAETMDASGESTRKIEEAKRGQGSPELVVNEFLNPLGFHVVLDRDGIPPSTLGVYDLESTGWVNVGDELGEGQFPVVFLGPNKLPSIMDPIPDELVAETNPYDGRLYVYDGYREKGRESVKNLKNQGFEEPEDLEAFDASYFQAVLNHEGAHLLLMLDRFNNSFESKEKVTVRAGFVNPKGGMNVWTHATTPIQLHEICGFAASYAQGGEELRWMIAQDLATTSGGERSQKHYGSFARLLPFLLLLDKNQPESAKAQGETVDMRHLFESIQTTTPAEFNKMGRHAYDLCYEGLMRAEAQTTSKGSL